MKTHEYIDFTDRLLNLEMNLMTTAMKAHELSDFLDSIVSHTHEKAVDVAGLKLLVTNSRYKVLDFKPSIVDPDTFIVKFQILGA